MTQSDKPITPAQLKKLQTMFTKLGFEKEDKAEMISLLTEGRVTSTKDITFKEAGHLINYLSGRFNTGKEAERKQQQQQAHSHVKAIYRLSCEMGMCYGDTPEDMAMNRAKINRFCRERGTVKKEIGQMSLAELKKTHKQFEAMLQKTLDSSVNRLVTSSLKLKEV